MHIVFISSRNFTLPLCFNLLLLLKKCSLIDLLNIFSICDLLFTSIIILIINTKDCFDFLIEMVSSVSHEKNLKCHFNGNFTSEVRVVHQEHDKVVKFPWFKTGLVRDAPLVHSKEFAFINVTIKIIINFPDDKINLRFKRFASKPG